MANEKTETTDAMRSVELIASAFCPAVIVDHGEPCPECIKKAGQVFRQLRATTELANHG